MLQASKSSFTHGSQSDTRHFPVNDYGLTGVWGLVQMEAKKYSPSGPDRPSPKLSTVLSTIRLAVSLIESLQKP